MPSPHYEALLTSVTLLRSCLLPDEFDPTGSYLDSSITIKAIAFRVLCHAEVEEYVEERVTEIAKLAWKSWENERFVSATALCLIAFCGREMKRPPDTYNAPGQNQQKGWPSLVDVHHKLNEAVTHFVRDVGRENHGIKEKNLLSLLLPIGMSHSKIDAVFLAEMDDFGIQRGAVAHKSTNAAVKLGVDPKAELDRVNRIVQKILELDAELDLILHSTMK